MSFEDAAAEPPNNLVRPGGAAAPGGQEAESFGPRTAVMLIIDALLVGGYFLLFSEVGYGATSFRYLSSQHHLRAPWLAAAGVVFLLCYLVDARLWTGGKATAAGFLFGVGGLCLSVGLIVSLQTIMYIPLAFFVLLQPSVQLAARAVLFSNSSIQNCLKSMAVSSCLAALFSWGITLKYYSNNDYWWWDDPEGRLHFIDALTSPRSPSDTGFCDATNETEREAEWENCGNGKECVVHDDCPCDTCAFTATDEGSEDCQCLAAFVLWGGMAVVSLVLCIHSLLFYLLSKLEAPDGPAPYICVLGGPGAGKSTHCEKMAAGGDFMHLSVGKLLRDEQEQEGSKYGAMIREHTERGTLVPTSVTVDLLHQAMSSGPTEATFLVDGFPRSLEQIEAADAKLGPPQAVVLLNVERDAMLQRVLGRGQTSGRDDDNEAAFAGMIETYENETMPVVKELKAQNKVTEIASGGDFESVYGRFSDIVFKIAEEGESLDLGPISGYMLGMIVFLLISWICGTLLGTAMHVSALVSSLGYIAVAEIVLLLMSVVGVFHVRRAVFGVAMLRRFYEIATLSIPDWTRAAILMLALPLLFIMAFLSCINQCMRKMGIGRPLEDDEKDAFFTKWWQDLFSQMKNEWDWTSILNKGMTIGVAYFILAVGISKISVVFLSWMNEALESHSVVFVCVAYLLVGEFMFLNPLCPATPVYLTGGVVVVRSMERYLSGCEAPSESLSAIRLCGRMDDGLTINTTNCGVVEYNGPVGVQNVSFSSCYNQSGYPVAQPQEITDVGMLCFCPNLHGGEWQENFWTAVAFGAFVTFVLKMLAIFLEQCAIGMMLGEYLWVRKLVMINSIEIRTFKLLLAAKGLTKPKCAILLGGPDWPVSVLTGILRLNVLQMLIGSSPFIFLNTPTVMGGAFQLRTAESEMWATLGIVGFAMALATQSTAGVFCWYYLFEAAEDRREELDAMELDKEVQAAEIIDAKKSAIYRKVVQWEKLPVVMKLLLIVGTIFQGMWLNLAIYAGGNCWQKLDVASPLSGPPLFAGMTASGTKRAQTVADWFSWIKPWDADCEYPKSANPECQDFNEAKGNLGSRPNGYGYVALSIFACGAVCSFLFNKWAGSQLRKEIDRQVASGEWDSQEMLDTPLSPTKGGDDRSFEDEMENPLARDSKGDESRPRDQFRGSIADMET